MSARESISRRLVALLREAPRTVAELADELGLTPNAVRARLEKLMRSGVATVSGFRPGVRRRHRTYALTAEAGRQFAKGGGVLMQSLLSALEQELPPDELVDLLSTAGQAAGRRLNGTPPPSATAGAEKAAAVLRELGGLPEVTTVDDSLRIESSGCPFGALPAEHPAVCRFAGALVSEISGLPAVEECDRESVPRCRFRLG